MFSRAIFLFFPASIAAQNLGAYLSPCSSDAPIPEVETAIINGYQLGSDAVCLPSDTAPDQGFEICPAPGVFDAYFTDADIYFRCAKSLSSTCNGGCSTGTFCISTTLPLSTLPFYFCGVPCAGGFYLCDDTATKYLNPSFTTFCDPVADQCGTCSSFESLLENGGCQPSATVSALPVRASGSRKRDVDKVVAYDYPQQDGQTAKGYSIRLLQEIRDMECPPRSQKCSMMPDGELEDDWECVAVKEDIESCGGCPGRGGVDCTRLPGVKFGASTCLDGICVAHQCTDDDSYILVNSTCVPTSAPVDFTDHLSNEAGSSPGTPSLHPDLSTEILVPEALRVLSALRARQNHYRQHDARSYRLGTSNTHPRGRRIASSQSGEGQAYHITRLKQARIDPEIEIIIHMRYSNPITTPHSSDERVSQPMYASTGENDDVEYVQDAIDGWEARIKLMENVRLVPRSSPES
ncbi:hypothetical protein QFC22_002515 [Naganishia vaughanmartiniae]|uniref:Uncharacterized protein n=1 Tax=Naganishia vaughanmartiniae TaxID=1424756 RepID=A0ACC2XB00_9TREE|nr:hypothetical protein QFC22_002515 [Naganishia vaughanmartiniae]